MLFYGKAYQPADASAATRPGGSAGSWRSSRPCSGCSPRSARCGPRRTPGARSSCWRASSGAARCTPLAGRDRASGPWSCGSPCSSGLLLARLPAGASAYLALAVASVDPGVRRRRGARQPARPDTPDRARARRRGGRRSLFLLRVIADTSGARLAAMADAARLGRGAAAVHRCPARWCWLLPLAASRVAARVAAAGSPLRRDVGSGCWPRATARRPRLRLLVLADRLRRCAASAASLLVWGSASARSPASSA